MTRWNVLPLVVSVLASCSSDEPEQKNEGPSEVTFPADFMWGSASAAFQVEKGLGGTDWGIWVKTPEKIRNGDDPDVGGADALAHIDEDVALLKAANQNTYRFSIEWARLYPTREAFDADTPDPTAIAAYDKLLGALRGAGIRPIVTLQHFTLPDWLSDPRKPEELQGWERPETVPAFGTWCQRVASRWAGQVDWWATINEPMAAPIAGYVQGSFPPGLLLKVDRALEVTRQEVLGHAKCYDAIKAADTTDADGDGRPTWIGIVQNLRSIEPEYADEPVDVEAAARVRYVNNLWFLNAVVRGDWDADFDGKLDGPNDRPADPALANRSDYLGINYYSPLTASARGLVLPVVNASIRQDRLLTDRPKTDFHWDIDPAGFRVILEEVRPYKLPIVITENGIADSTDRNRARYLLEHLYQLALARESGLDIRGYVYWSLLDNFEWAHGYCPRFGLHTVDPTTGARVARPSTAVYANLSKTGLIKRAEIEALPPYAPPTYCD
jgi:beta-glucosidase/6-phospho-beta-glucosidase/beta-galactosidase